MVWLSQAKQKFLKFIATISKWFSPEAPEPTPELTVEQAKNIVRMFWAVPKVEHGQAQVPHLYSEADLDLLNKASDVLRKNNVDVAPLLGK